MNGCNGAKLYDFNYILFLLYGVLCIKMQTEVFCTDGKPILASFSFYLLTKIFKKHFFFKSKFASVITGAFAVWCSISENFLPSNIA